MPSVDLLSPKRFSFLNKALNHWFIGSAMGHGTPTKCDPQNFDPSPVPQFNGVQAPTKMSKNMDDSSII